jgi:AcrR family transcriptional regulator
VEPALRREQILSQAALLFGRKGYHGTSIADIIKSAGIARGTFYLYFKNKRALFDEILDMLVVQIKGRIRKVELGEGAPPVKEQIAANVTGVLELLTTNRALLSILLEGAVGLDKGFAAKLGEFYEQIAATVDASLRLGQEMGLIRPCNSRTAALMGLGALKEVLHDTLRTNRDMGNIETIVSELLDVYLNGVSPIS